LDPPTYPQFSKRKSLSISRTLSQSAPATFAGFFPTPRRIQKAIAGFAGRSPSQILSVILSAAKNPKRTSQANTRCYQAGGLGRAEKA
jgi:hypothetical protein